MNKMEWDRGTGPGPSGKGEDEKRAFFFDETGDSRCSRLDPEFGSGKRTKNVRFSLTRRATRVALAWIQNSDPGKGMFSRGENKWFW